MITVRLRWTQDPGPSTPHNTAQHSAAQRRAAASALTEPSCMQIPHVRTRLAARARRLHCGAQVTAENLTLLLLLLPLLLGPSPRCSTARWSRTPAAAAAAVAADRMEDPLTAVLTGCGSW